MSLGQILGFAGGAVLGAVLAGPLGFVGAGIIQAIAIGASVGSFVGNLIDPERIGNQEAQHEIRSVTYNTYDHDLPVPILFGKRKITGNIIFIGDTFGRVEDVGDQRVGQGKSEQEVDVFAVVYYADFIIGLGEGEFTDFLKVFQDRVEITDQEGDLFTLRPGEEVEVVPEIMVNSPNPVLFPTGYSKTAQLIWSGKIGQINHIPSIEVEAVGPSLKHTVSGSASGLPNTITQFMYDDISRFVIAQTSATTFQSFYRDGTGLLTTTIPSDYSIENAFFDGRRATVVVFTQAVFGAKWMLVGELGFDAASDWQLVPMTILASQQSDIKSWCMDDGKGVIITTYITAQGVVVVRTNIVTFEQVQTVLPIDTTNMLIRGTYYEKTEELHYILFSQAGNLSIQRTDLDHPGETEEMTMDNSFVWSNPIGIAVTGELITIFDTGVDQPVVQFEWGRTIKRYDRGFKFTVASFTPDQIDDLEIWYAADKELGYVNGNTVGVISDHSGNNLDAVQGTTNNQPTYITNAVNGKSVFRFNGTDNFLRTLNTTISRQNMTIFAVHKPTGTATEGRILLLAASAVTNDKYSTYIASGGPASNAIRNGKVWQSQDDDDFDMTNYTLVPNTWQIAEVIGSDDGYTTYKNGGLIGTHEHEHLGTLDVKLWIGTHHSQASWYKGDLAEILIYDRVLDDDEREKVEMYLRRKYNIEYNAALPEYAYFGIGDRMTYANPVQFFFADQIQAMFVLDLTATGWFLSWCHWNGDNWSYLKKTEYSHVYFEEEGTAGGALFQVFAHQRYGIGTDTDFLGLAKLERLSGFCNRPVDMRYYTNDEVVYAAAFQINYLLAANKKLSQIVREFLTAINGYLFYSGGELNFLIDRDNGIVEFEDNLDTILDGSFTFWEIAREDKWNKVRIDVKDERNDYKSTPVQATAEWERDIYRETRITTITAEACTRPRQGVALAVNSMLGQTMRRYACKYRVGPQALQREVGDVGTVTHWKPQWDKKKFMIIAISETEDDEMEITLLEHIPNIHTVGTFPLQQPQLTLQLSEGTEGSFDDVQPPVRVRVLEDTLEGRAFLLASKPNNSGPWKFLRWYAKWVASNNPGASFYPGNIPFSSTIDTAFLISGDFTASGLLKTTMTLTQLTIELTGLSADPPEANFDVIIYNPAIPVGTFLGQYERCQGALFNSSNNIITLDSGGRAYGTPAFAHTVLNINVGATYVRHSNTNGVIIKYQDNSITNNTNAPDPLVQDNDEWYIGFDSASFSPPNAINVAVLAGGNPGNNGPWLDFEVWYSSGQGLWTKILSVNDDTNGFDQSGRITIDPPTDWATTTQYVPGTASSTFFKNYTTGGSATTAPARYYLKIVRINNLKNSNNILSLVNQTNYNAAGQVAPIVYFIKHNAFPFYDTVPAEQGFKLAFKAQPIGHHGQTIDLPDLAAYEKTFQNLAGEGS